MTEVRYEFPNEDPSIEVGAGRPRRSWLIVLLASPLLVAAVWGIAVLERIRTETLARDAFNMETDTSDEVIAAISRFPVVRSESVALLANYPRLQLLDLSGTASLAGGLHSLRQLHNLRVLLLRNCTWVDDEQAACLAELQNLRHLNLSGTSITDAGLLAISKLPQLSGLRMEQCQNVTDAGLDICAGMDQLWYLEPGGAGYSVKGLFALRERRPDLNLQLQLTEFLEGVTQYFVIGTPWDGLVEDLQTHGQSGVKCTLSTPADVAALRNLLRFKQQWEYRPYGDGAALRNVREGHESNYVEHIEQTWGALELHGPAAGEALATVLPLTPKLVELTLHNTTISSDEFPVQLLPQGLHRLHLVSMAVSQPLLQRLSHDSHVRQLDLSQVRVDEIDKISARFGNVTAFGEMPIAGRADRQAEHEPWTSLELHAKSVEQPLEKLLPLVPQLAVLKFYGAELNAEHFPFDLLPPKLRLHATNSDVSDAFWQILGQTTALEHLVLFGVALKGVDLADPALGHLTSLQFLRLGDVTVNGVDLTDTALEPFRARLQAQLPQARAVISSSSDFDKRIEWGDVPEH
ncbi:MAG: hypothetical protein AB7U20_08210 [Planctomycetaceae bacterium]